MAAPAETSGEYIPITTDQRLLTEVRHLAANRQGNGHDPAVLRDELLNLKTAVHEAAIPHAVTTTEHEYIPCDPRRGTIMWMGKTAIQNAQSGYKFHRHRAARQRVDWEVDEAHHAQEDLRPGIMKFFISPRMSETDADNKTAKAEHLADDDAVRVSWLTVNEDGSIAKRVMQSLLVRDIPLQAWVDMLADPNNLFGKAITVDNPDSALSIMKVHRELEVPLGLCPNGPVDLVRAVALYITDSDAKVSVQTQLGRFETDQRKLDQQAEIVARKWLDFEVELDNSYRDGQATFEIKRFIIGLQHDWSDDDLAVINNHSFDGEYVMTDKLAIVLERAKQNLLWTDAGVLTGSERIVNQIDSETLTKMQDNLRYIYAPQYAGFMEHERAQREAENNRLTAQANVKTGGGCAGDNQASFKSGQQQGTQDVQSNENSNDWKKDPKSWKRGVCQVKSCHTRPGSTMVGPCSVYVSCQGKFDQGEDPTTESVPEQTKPKDLGLLRQISRERGNKPDHKSNRRKLGTRSVEMSLQIR